ncbi:MAG: hypothetical protein H8K07_17955 [Nitrospira sp.]|jgi:hypothetical protein|nr:hypothetical protein [Nitrospira sp.]MDI3462228.1 hypothetical protein [Nitrospira sp.]
MNRIDRGSLGAFYCATGLTCFVVLLCICIITQMLGSPVTLFGILSSDVLAESDPISEDFSALSSSPEPERPLLSHALTEFRSIRHLPLVLISVFRPPSAESDLLSSTIARSDF